MSKAVLRACLGPRPLPQPPVCYRTTLEHLSRQCQPDPTQMMVAEYPRLRELMILPPPYPSDVADEIAVLEYLVFGRDLAAGTFWGCTRRASWAASEQRHSLSTLLGTLIESKCHDHDDRTHERAATRR